MDQIKKNIENYAFGVCSYLGEKFNINSGTIRLYFIYISFFTLGSPVVIYFIVAFWLNIRHYLTSRRHSVWDL
ncbi:MAG: PspC family transcriptional regulator [Bacteroidetes bacterium]|nr:MAG: PspC family transcriptional regulator [Bacteroidota bacterium]